MAVKIYAIEISLS